MSKKKPRLLRQTHFPFYVKSQTLIDIHLEQSVWLHSIKVDTTTFSNRDEIIVYLDDLEKKVFYGKIPSNFPYREVKSIKVVANFSDFRQGILTLTYEGDWIPPTYIGDYAEYGEQGAYSPAGTWIIKDTGERPAIAVVLKNLKGSVLPSGGVIADPTGAVVSYEGGWCARALIHRNEMTLAKKILDQMVLCQLSSNGWAQQYYPLRLPSGAYSPTERDPNLSHREVDSGASLMAWAMAEYDKKMGTTDYLTPVRKAMAFLRTCQQIHNLYHGSNLLANQKLVYKDQSEAWNTGALSADCGEALLSACQCLETYGDTLTDINGYSVKTFANDLYYDIANKFWMGSLNPSEQDDAHFRTEYPAGTIILDMPENIVPQCISYTQALCSLAIYKWAHSPFNTKPDYSFICEKALNKAVALTQGKWGGFYYHPIGEIYGAGMSGKGYDIYDEFPSFTALMIIAMKTVNQTKYQANIDRALNFIQKITTHEGAIFNRVHINGRIDQDGEGRLHFRTLNSAQCILAGAYEGVATSNQVDVVNREGRYLGLVWQTGIAHAPEGRKITKLEFTYDAEGDISTIIAKEYALPLYTLTFGYDAQKKLTSITRS
jgi:hypothetical protein